MSTKTTPGLNDTGTDPRPTYIAIGTDTTGADHIYHTRRERILVINDEEREHVQALGRQDVHDWMDHVETVRGWSSRSMYRSFGASLADNTEADH